MTKRVAHAGLAIGAGAGLGLLVTSVRAAILHLGDIDFDVFYQSGQAWRTGGDLYVASRAFPNLNPPQFAVAFSPLTMMPPTAALVLWQAINVACAIAAGVIVWRELQLPRSFAAVSCALPPRGSRRGCRSHLKKDS